MTKDEFVTERTRIISEMLDNPDKHGIYPTTKCFAELDALFDKLTSDNSDYVKCGCGSTTDIDVYCQECLTKIAERGN